MCNLLQFSQAALEAEISDGDYRTFMILCSLAADNHQERGYFTVDLTYAEIGQNHPKLLSAAGVRSRINRLVKAGLVTRRRVDNRQWRTIPVGDNSAAIPSGVMAEHTQAVALQNTQPVEAVPPATPNPTGDTIHSTQVSQPLPPAAPKSLAVASDSTLAGATDSTQRASVLPISTPTAMTVPVDSTQSLVGAATEHTQPTVTETEHGTQISLTVALDDGQHAVHVLFEEEQISVFDGEMNPLGHKQDSFIETEPVPRSEDSHADGKDFMNRSLARRVLVRTAIEQAEAFLNGTLVTDVGVVSENALSMISDHDHDDLNNSSIHDHDQKQSESKSANAAEYDGLTKEATLATVLANLPQPMTPGGIVECTADPELCAAWLDYATNPTAGVRNPAAYVRKGIRSGHYPPSISKTYISPNSPVYRPSYAEIVQSKPSAA